MRPHNAARDDWVMLSCRLRRELRRRLKVTAFQEGRSMAAIVEEALEKELNLREQLMRKEEES